MLSRQADRLGVGALILITVFLAAASALADRPYGTDLSHWNGTITPAQWETLYQEGWVFAFTKASESPYYYSTDQCAGSWYTDTTFVNNMINARGAGILIGAYHFAHPQCYTPTYEATGFVTIAGDYITGGYLRPVLDLEDGYDLGPTAMSTWVNGFLDAVELQTGVEPFIYTNTNYALYCLNSTVAARDLWIAQYLYDPDPQNDIPNIGVFNDWIFWQYTSGGTLPGLTGSHDLNVFNGTLASLQAYVIPGESTPPFIVESRSGGQHYTNYSEIGTWTDGSTKSSAAGCTTGIGHRWCAISSTAVTAVFTYTPSATGTYEVFTTNCTTANSGNPLIHKVTHTGGTTDVGVCQNTTCSPNAVNTWYSLGQYTLNSGTQYSVTLDGSTGGGSGPTNNAGRSDAIKWVLVAGTDEPAITAHPENETVAAGETASFTITASGATPLSYQWQKNQANLTNGGHYSGCTTATLTITNADSNDEADYRCVVTNDYGIATSEDANLSLATPISEFIVESRTGGQNFANYSETGGWSNASSKSTAAGCTTGIGHRFCTIASSSAPTATFGFTPTVTGSYQIYTTNCSTANSGNPLVHKVNHTGGTTNVNVCQNTTCSPTAANTWYDLGSYTLNASTAYSVVIDGTSSSGSGPTGWAGRSDAIKWVLMSASGPTINQHPTAQSVCAGSIASFSVSASGQGTLTYQWQKNSANITNGGHYSGCTTTTLTVSNINSSDVANYRCIVTDAVGNTASNQAALSLKATTVITLHPSSQNLDAGDTANFVVSATGDGTLTYQWQKNSANITNGSRISGATTATLQITSLVTSDAGNYRCVVTGNCGSETSNAAALTVAPAGQPGDFDDDSDVDLVDFGLIQQCLGISSPFGDTGCGPADLNGDSIIDGQDITLFQGCMSGSHIPASLDCAGGS